MNHNRKRRIGRNRAGQAAIQIEKLGTHPTEEQLIRSFRKIISHTRA